MRILFVGDVVGKPGRQAVAKVLPGLREEHSVDVTIVNGENSAGGKGLSAGCIRDLRLAGADVITCGNHTWAQREIGPLLDGDPRVIRPLNYPPGVPGRGWTVAGGVLVLQVLGRVFMQPNDCPFRGIDAVLDAHAGADGPRLTVVDVHAEATSEKVVLGWYLDGRVTAVIGTHTHVPTADARVLPKGTAHVTDVGMVGPTNSALGVDPWRVIGHLKTGMPHRFDVAEGPVQFNSVLIDADETTGRARSITRLDRIVDADAILPYP